MKTNRLYSLMILLWMAIGVNAQEINKLYIPDVNVEVGKQFQLPVYVQNTSQKITGLQFTLAIPKGVIPDFNDVKLTERSENHKVRVHQDNDSQWTLMLYSTKNTTIRANAGIILNIPTIVADSVKEGSVKVLGMEKVALSDSLGNNVLTEFSCGNINVMNTIDFAVTDVNCNLTTIIPEDHFTVTWNVKNIGPVASTGGWSENVSLVSENGESKVLGSLKYDGILDANAEVPRSLDVVLDRIIGLDGKAKIVVELIPDENSGEIKSKVANNIAESEENGITILNKLYVTFPSQVNEPANDSTLVMSVVRSGSSKNALNIAVSKIGDERLVLPENIVIPASESEAIVNLILKSDDLLNEEQTFTIIIETEGYETINHTMTVLDDDAIFPNLHVTEVVCAEPTAGTLTEISWKVKNDGHVGTGEVQWKDYIWLLPEVQGGTSMRGAILLGSYDNLSALEPGDSYENRVSITMPEENYGNYDLVVMSDMASLDDIDFSATDGVPPYPYEPATAEYGYFKGKTYASEVKVREAGETNGVSDNFFYIRIDIQVPPLPDIAVTKVVAIVDTSVDGNPSPLSMAGLASSAAFYSGKKVTLTVTVMNQGGTDVTDAYVTNRVYISHSEDNDAEDLRLLNTQSSQISLAKDESKNITLTCQIPYEWSGDSWFHVQIDEGESVGELANIANNWGHSDMSYVLLTPGADFKVHQLKVPTTITAGLPFNISYTVNNIGPGVPYVDSWTDNVYLSSNPNGLDESAILLDSYLQKGAYKKVNGNTVYSGDNYSVTRTFNAPLITSGNYYLYLVVDTEDEVFEFEGEDNNIAISSPIECFVPELTSELVSIASENLVLSGSSLFSWKLKNTGKGDIKDAIIYNTFYASSSDNGTDPIFLYSVKDTISIASGEELSMDGIVNIPDNSRLLGNKYVFLVVNTENTIAEDNHDNNQSNVMDKIFEPSANLTITKVTYPTLMTKGETATIKISLKNASNFPITGDATVQVTLLFPNTTNKVTLPISNPTLLVDGLAVGASKDVEIVATIPDDFKGGMKYANVIVTPSDQSSEGSKPSSYLSEVYILGNLPDLTISSYDVPESILTATPTAISWTVSNIGEWDSQKSTYQVLLKDNVENIFIILKEGKLSTIPKGGNVTVNTTITIDDNRFGEKYLYISIIEGGDEDNKDNNSVYIPVVIGQSELPDLVLSDIAVDGALKNGETATITARVTNKGLGTTRTNTWTDVFYLSTESEFSESQAIKLGSKMHSGYLSAEESYEITVKLNVPINAHGNYYLYGFTDVTNRNIEAGKENNIDKLEVYVEDKTDSPAQLVVSSLSAPSNIVAGEKITLSYKVSNNGQFDANGTLRDIIYLSKDSKWDQDDEMVGVVSGSVDITSNTGLTREVKGRILNMTEGNYYLIVKTNTTRNIIETDYADNIAVTSHPVKISFASLSPGATSSVHTSGYYKLDVSGSTEGKTLGFYLSHDEEEPCGVYVSYERVPSTAMYDWSSATMMVSEQEVLVPKVKSGTYYILAQANTIASLNTNKFFLSDESDETSDVNMTLTVKDIPFGATSLSVKEGGTEGWVSTKIRGALLDSIMDFRLAKSDNEIPVEALTFHDQTYTVATFNLNRAETGSYDIISELPDGSQARLQNGFTVVPGMSVKLGVKLSLPGAVRGYVMAPISIAYANGGNTDIALKELLIVAENGVLSKSVNGLNEAKSELIIVPETGQDKRGYVSIPPGTQDVINCFVGTSGNCTITVYVVK